MFKITRKYTNSKEYYFKIQTRIKEGLKLDRSNIRASLMGKTFSEFCDALWRTEIKHGSWKGGII